MRRLEVKAESGHSLVLAGESISKLSDYLNLSRVVIVADENVVTLHKDKLPSCPIIELEGGESLKTLNRIDYLYSQFLELELDRSSCVLAVGGGTVCDAVGFASATYLRGLRSAFAPTTLLAQVDASVGGKNGVDYKGYKNLIGTIRQPELVLCDFDFLKTLPGSDLRSGFAEIIKHAVIADGVYFDFLAANVQSALELQPEAIEKSVYDSLVIKSSVVERDERETAERMKLNFGHTVGHAIELDCGLLHGEAVSIGMVAESELSVRRGLLSTHDADRIAGLLSAFGLPVDMRGEAQMMKASIQKDKKRRKDSLGMTLLSGIGSSRIEQIPIGEIERLIDDLCSNC